MTAPVDLFVELATTTGAVLAVFVVATCVYYALAAATIVAICHLEPQLAAPRLDGPLVVILVLALLPAIVVFERARRRWPAAARLTSWLLGEPPLDPSYRY